MNQNLKNWELQTVRELQEARSKVFQLQALLKKIKFCQQEEIRTKKRAKAAAPSPEDLH